MASPSSPTGTHGNPDNSPNRPTTLVEGGASAYPTPANNVGGGRGWGDEGFLKGGTGKEPPGHIFARNPKSTMGNFETLENQKKIAGAHTEERFNRSAGHPGKDKAEEDHTFMEHAPGCPHTLPGWNKAKNAVEGMNSRK